MKANRDESVMDSVPQSIFKYMDMLRELSNACFADREIDIKKCVLALRNLSEYEEKIEPVLNMLFEPLLKYPNYKMYAFFQITSIPLEEDFVELIDIYERKGILLKPKDEILETIKSASGKQYIWIVIRYYSDNVVSTVQKTLDRLKEYLAGTGIPVSISIRNPPTQYTEEVKQRLISLGIFGCEKRMGCEGIIIL